MEAHRVTLDHQGSTQKLELDSPEADIPVLVRASEHRLAQVFENLIVNALSFSPPDGVVTIKILPDKERVTVTVTDQGAGIPDTKLESIFERFYTERPKHEDYGSHSGLGLSIARQIVRSHNGSIFAENIRDFSGRVTGARFTVILNRV
jgi:two-component system sensor histidine kinase ChvG